MQTRSTRFVAACILLSLTWLMGCGGLTPTPAPPTPHPIAKTPVSTPQLEQVGETVIATAPPLATIDSHYTLRPYDPQRDNYAVSVIGKVPNWEGSKKPGHSRWQVNFPSNDAALIAMGWCTTDRQTLDDNWGKMEYALSIDGRNIPLNQLKLTEWSERDRVCYGYSGVLTDWGIGKHSYIWTHHIFETLNDGWDTYIAGDYIMDFAVTVTR